MGTHPIFESDFDCLTDFCNEMSPPASGKSDNFVVNFLLGGVSGGISKTCVAPIERVKLLLQNQVASHHMAQMGHKPYTGMVNCFVRVFREEGATALWRGNLANIIRYFPTQAISLSCKDKYSAMIPKYNKDTDFMLFAGRHLLIGGMAGLTALPFVYPLDFARTRMGVDVGKSVAERQFKGIGDCVKQIYKADGFVGLYQGFAISAVGIFIFRACFFGSYEIMKGMMYDDPKSAPMYMAFVFGFAAETVAGLVAYPIDTIRRRLMMQSGVPVEERLYKGTVSCAKTIMEKEGGAAFFKGAGSNILRGMGGAIVLAVYDEFKKHL